MHWEIFYWLLRGYQTLYSEINLKNREHQKKWKQKNRELALRRQREMYARRKDEPAYRLHRNEIHRRGYYRNHEHSKEANRLWRKKHHAQVRARYKKFYEKNRVRLIAKTTAYAKARYAIDPFWRLKMCLRARIGHALRAGKGRKWNKTVLYLGCSFEQAREHIEKQFKPGMTWKNHGSVWEIDHIRPVAAFDMTVLEQQKQCFHYTNLQPLWKHDNRVKWKHEKSGLVKPGTVVA